MFIIKYLFSSFFSYFSPKLFRSFINARALVFLPFEVYAREIETRLSLAAYFAASSDVICFIAPDLLARSLSLIMPRKSLFVGKHIYSISGSTKNVSQAIRLLSAGVKVIFVDEEGGLGLTTTDHDYDVESWRNRLIIARNDIPVHLLSNFICTYWGHYQYELTQSDPLSKPSFDSCALHRIIGAPFIDAAKVMNKGFALNAIPGISNSDSICIMGKNSLISQRNFLRLNVYDRLLDMHRLGFDLHLSLNEEFSPMILIRKILDSSCCDRIIYRPHPCASSIELEQFLSSLRKDYSSKFCTSRPSSDPIYSFLSGITYIFHPGCSTSLQASFVGVKTVNVSSTVLPSQISLVDEVCSTSDDVDTLKSMASIPKPKPHIYKLVYNLNDSNLDCFDSLNEIVKSLLSEKSVLSPESFGYFMLQVLFNSLFFLSSSLRFYFKSVVVNLFRLFPSHGLGVIYAFRLRGKRPVLGWPKLSKCLDSSLSGLRSFGVNTKSIRLQNFLALLIIY